MEHLPQAFDAESTSDSTSETVSDDEGEQQLEALFQRAAAQQQQQQPQQDEDRLLVKTMLESLGFEKKHIEKGMRLYEIQYGNNSGYDADQITQIILRLQEKEAIKKQKKQLLAMDLDPKLAAELFGGSIKSKTRSKTSGYHRGNMIMYRDKLSAQIMDKYDEYLLICWPITKPLYQRAILWVNIKDVKQMKEGKKSSKTKEKSGLFRGMFGGFESLDKKEKEFQLTYKFEKLWRDLMVKELGKDSEQKTEQKKKDVLCQMMDINLMRDKGLKIKSKFMKQTHNKYAVCGAYELYNETVTRLYNKRKELILRFSLDSDENKLNEYKLWYVISRRNVFKIINDGFKRKYGTPHAYGLGHAFYRNAHDALLVAQYGNFNKIKKDGDNVQYLLYCSVICGESCLGHKDMKVPTHKPNKSYILYETAVDNFKLDENKYFITFQDYQAIPHYVMCVKAKQVQKKQKKASKNKSPYDQMFASAPFPPQQLHIKPDHNLPNIPNYQQLAPFFMNMNQANQPNINQPPAPPPQLFGGPPPPVPQQQQHHQHHHRHQYGRPPQAPQQRRRPHRNRRNRNEAPPVPQLQPEQHRMHFRQMPPQFHYVPAPNNNNNNAAAAPLPPRLLQQQQLQQLAQQQQMQQQQQQQQQQQNEDDQNLFDSV